MNREILFRGKRIDNGEWVEGGYGEIPAPPVCIGERGKLTVCIVAPDSRYMPDWGLPYKMAMYEVDPATIEEYTGLTDKNGRKIFEGDILRFPPKTAWDKDNFESYEVFWHDNDCCDRHIGWQMNRLHFHGALCGKDIDFTTFKPEYVSKMEIIGNVLDTNA